MGGGTEMGGHHRVVDLLAEDSASPDPGTAPGRHRANPALPTLEEFNQAGDDEAALLLQSCLEIPEWVARVADGRPYPSLQVLHQAGAAAAATISWRQVAGALDRHPRIGENKAAVAGTDGESAWSADEQGGVEAAHAAALAVGNAAYEARFGFIYLVCAAGLSGEQILQGLQDRLRHGDDAEHLVVMAELRKIAALRLAKAVAP